MTFAALEGWLSGRSLGAIYFATYPNNQRLVTPTDRGMVGEVNGTEELVTQLPWAPG